MKSITKNKLESTAEEIFKKDIFMQFRKVYITTSDNDYIIEAEDESQEEGIAYFYKICDYIAYSLMYVASGEDKKFLSNIVGTVFKIPDYIESFCNNVVGNDEVEFDFEMLQDELKSYYACDCDIVEINDYGDIEGYITDFLITLCNLNGYEVVDSVEDGVHDDRINELEEKYTGVDKSKINKAVIALLGVTFKEANAENKKKYDYYYIITYCGVLLYKYGKARQKSAIQLLNIIFDIQHKRYNLDKSSCECLKQYFDSSIDTGYIAGVNTIINNSSDLYVIEKMTDSIYNITKEVIKNG